MVTCMYTEPPHTFEDLLKPFALEIQEMAEWLRDLSGFTPFVRVRRVTGSAGVTSASPGDREAR